MIVLGRLHACQTFCHFAFSCHPGVSANIPDVASHFEETQRTEYGWNWSGQRPRYRLSMQGTLYKEAHDLTL